MNQPNPVSVSPWTSWAVTYLTKFHRYKSLLKKRWWILVLTIGAALVYEGSKIATEAPMYQSVARMMVKVKVSLPEGSVYSEEYANFFGTQMELMQCGEVQSRARSRLQVMQPHLQALPVHLNVYLTPRTSIFVLKAIGSDPTYTQSFLDACMEEYINLKQEMRSQTSESTLAAITEELSKLEKEMRAGEEELFQFQKDNNIVFLQEQGNSVGSYLVNLNGQLSSLKIEYQLLQLLTVEQNVDRQLKPNAGLDTSQDGKPIFGNNSLSDPGSEYVKGKRQIWIMKANRDELLKKFKPEHPKILKLNEEIAQMEQLIGLFELQSKEQLKSRQNSLELRIKNLESNIKESEAKALDVSRRMAEYSRIKSKLTRMQGLHEHLLSSMQSLGVNKNIDQEVLSTMEHASPAVSINPSFFRRLLLFSIFGLFLGLAILILIDRLDDRLFSLTELRDYFDLPLLGHVPFEPTLENSPEKTLLLSNNATRHLFVESFRNIRSSLLFMLRDGERPKNILITSGSPGEGKSVTAANLAITLAGAGSRVLLIDADLRRGTIHKLFGLSSKKGLTDVLLQRAKWEEVVVECTSHPGLLIMCNGEKTSKPGELFLSPYTDILLREIRNAFDYVIFDSAPVLAADDTPTLAPKMDGVLFLIRASFTSARLAQNSLELLYGRQVKVLGLVFNRVDTSLPDYYYYQYHKYDPQHMEASPSNVVDLGKAKEASSEKSRLR